MKFNHKSLFAIGTLVCLLVIAGNTKTVSAQNKVSDPNPKDILAAAVKTVKELKSASYEATFETSFSGKPFFIKGQVEVRRGGVSNQTLPGMIYIKSEGSKGRQEISFDGKIARRLDYDKKSLTEGIADKGGIGVAMSAGLSLLQWDFIQTDPFKFESAAAVSEYVGLATVGGILCHVVDLKYSVPGTEISGGRWWFAVEDNLPRMYQTIENAKTGKIVRELRITNLQMGNGIPEARFKIELPEGYAYSTFSSAGANAKLIPVGNIAPDWALLDKTGQQHRLSDYRGKVVVLEFWASWCGYCKLSIPAMQNIHEKFSGKGVKVLGVNFQEQDETDPNDFLKSKGGTYLTVLNGDKIAQVYGATSVPAFVVINREGKVVFTAREYNPNVGKQLTEAIEQALSTNE